MKTAIASLMLFVSMSSVCQAGVLKDEYELKKKCGEDAYNYFGNLEKPGIKRDYKSHYNKKLNTCFISFISITVRNDESQLIHRSLTNILENDMIAYYTKDSNNEDLKFCVVNGVNCKSEKEYDQMIKPYMKQ